MATQKSVQEESGQKVEKLYGSPDTAILIEIRDTLKLIRRDMHRMHSGSPNADEDGCNCLHYYYTTSMEAWECPFHTYGSREMHVERLKQEGKI